MRSLRYGNYEDLSRDDLIYQLEDIENELEDVQGQLEYESQISKYWKDVVYDLYIAKIASSERDFNEKLCDVFRVIIEKRL